MKLDPDVTPEMIRAGNRMANELIAAGVARNLNGLGGSETRAEWEARPIPNRDLVVQYLEKNIDSVTAIFLAMSRAAP